MHLAYERKKNTLKCKSLHISPFFMLARHPRMLCVTCHLSTSFFLFISSFFFFFCFSSSPTSGCVRLHDHGRRPCMIDSLACAWGRHPVSAQTRSPIATAVVSSLAIPASNSLTAFHLSAVIHQRSTLAEANIYACFNWLAVSSLISG